LLQKQKGITFRLNEDEVDESQSAENDEDALVSSMLGGLNLYSVLIVVCNLFIDFG
jgi:hypothetical protein